MTTLYPIISAEIAKNVIQCLHDKHTLPLLQSPTNAAAAASPAPIRGLSGVREAVTRRHYRRYRRPVRSLVCRHCPANAATEPQEARQDNSIVRRADETYRKRRFILDSFKQSYYTCSINIVRRYFGETMDAQIETLDEQTEREIEIALDELRSVQFFGNTYTQAVEAREEVEIIIRALAKRLTPLAPDAACPNCGNADRILRHDIEQCDACGCPSPTSH